MGNSDWFVLKCVGSIMLQCLYASGRVFVFKLSLFLFMQIYSLETCTFCKFPFSKTFRCIETMDRPGRTQPLAANLNNLAWLYVHWPWHMYHSVETICLSKVQFECKIIMEWNSLVGTGEWVSEREREKGRAEGRTEMSILENNILPFEPLRRAHFNITQNQIRNVWLIKF